MQIREHVAGHDSVIASGTTAYARMRLFAIDVQGRFRVARYRCCLLTVAHAAGRNRRIQSRFGFLWQR